MTQKKRPDASTQKHAGPRKIMTNHPSDNPAAGPPWPKILRRMLTTILMAALIGWLIHQLASVMDHSQSPAGFARGMVQGALMPAALPNLLVGSDVVIYAQNNTDISYKLGYITGVNVCGAIFFGIFFWRLNRLRRGLNGGSKKED